MSSLDMSGPYVLVPDQIDEQVSAKKAGAFALGYVCDGDFIVRYIGRSDTDLNKELKDWVFRKSDCIFFKYLTTSSPREAFEKECTSFHDFGGTTGLTNGSHPQRPEGSGWLCPKCKIYAE